MFYNAHTHKKILSPDTRLVVNQYPTEYDPDEPFVSLGIHPWHVSAQSRSGLATMASLLQQRNVVAVGECGLDKCCEADYDLQQTVFMAQMKMAAVVQKPVIVHCVKAQDDLFRILSSLPALPPAVMIHGFRGKIQQAQQLIAHGCLLSFGLRYNTETVEAVPDGTFLLETDDTDTDISEIYKSVAEVRHCPVSELETNVACTAQEFFRIK